MGLGLDIRLRLLVPAVENSISAAAMHPGDILPARKGLTVEVNNTDAEGRLVLADALALADAERPDLIVSLATLTGAARVALGPDMPPFFTDDDASPPTSPAAATERRSALAPAVLDALRAADRARGRRPRQCARRRHGRRDHRGALSSPLRHRPLAVSASRPLWLDTRRNPGGQGRPPSRRRARCRRSWRDRFCSAT